MLPFSIVILAAGQSKRMRSAKPKLLHLLAGKPILEHVIQTVQCLNPDHIYIVYGHEGEQLHRRFKDYPVSWVKQEEQLGTGHALMQAMLFVNEKSRVLALYGDNPLISVNTLKELLKKCPEKNLGLVTMTMPDPTGLGRILRDANGKVCGIVEEKDATDTQRKIQEINAGIMVAPARYFNEWLPALSNDNKQQEYYLPDIISFAIAEGLAITTVSADMPEEVQGINDRAQLAKLERYYQQQLAHRFMNEGITIIDPARFDVRGELQAAQDVTIDIDVIIEGKVIIGTNSLIGPHTILRNVKIGKNVTIQSHCVIEDAVIADHCVIGPFARIRPGTVLDEKIHIGNFVEIKNSQIGNESKINHLSYIGDAVVGTAVNIGAGTITCNYDGVNKHQTVIEDHVSIGSDTQLVAPVTVGAGATVGAGSTITQNVPPHTLTLTHRIEQRVVKDWKRPEKKG